MIRLGHTNIRVADLERSVKFYENAFGLKVMKRLENPAFSMAWMCDERQEREELPFFLEIRHDKGHDAPYDLGENSTHIAFLVDNASVLNLLHRNMEIIDFESGNGIYFVHDPDGYSVEVMPRDFLVSNLRGNA